MINLRYHIVSLVAVFLALALGVLAGTTVLDEGVVRLLEAERDQLAGHRDRLSAENATLDEELQLWERFGRSVVPDLTRGRLQGSDVVFLTQEGVADPVMDGMRAQLEHAGARIAGRVAFTSKWALRDDPSREQLALVLGTDASDPPEMLAEAAARVAARLVAGGDAREASDLLQALARNGFVALEDAEQQRFPRRDALLVVVGTAAADPQPPLEAFLVPLLSAVQDQMAVAVAQPLEVSEPIVDHVRGDDVLNQTVSTVDHVNTLLGELSLVYALRDERDGRAAAHLGVRDGASGIVPQVDR